MLAEHGRTNLRLAETEKYAHVTYFFNCGREQPYPGEDRILVPSQKVATYDLKPEMSAPGIADEMIATLTAGKHQVVICNFANADMVGHTGRLDAAVAAVETLDTCLGRIVKTLQAVRRTCGDHRGSRQRRADVGRHAQGAAYRSHLEPRAGDPLTTRRTSGGRSVMARSATWRRRCWRCWGSRSRRR